MFFPGDVPIIPPSTETFDVRQDVKDAVSNIQGMNTRMEQEFTETLRHAHEEAVRRASSDAHDQTMPAVERVRTARSHVEHQSTFVSFEDTHDCPSQLASLQSQFNSKKKEYETQIQKMQSEHEHKLTEITGELDAKIQSTNRKNQKD